MKDKRKTNYLSLFFMCFLLFCLNSCATQSLWRSSNIVKKEHLTGNSNQIYHCCIDGNCDLQKFLLPYILNKKGLGLQNAFPPFEQGYIVINNQECISSISNGVIFVANDPSLHKESSIYANLIKRIKPDGSKIQYLKMDIRSKRQNYPGISSQLKDNQQLFAYSVTNRSQFDDYGRVISKGTTIFSLGNNKCRHLKGSGVTEIDFSKEIGFTSPNDKWLPIIDNKFPLPINIVFTIEKEEKIYRYTTAERTVLTPFAILADVIITPIAFVTVPLWMPK